MTGRSEILPFHTIRVKFLAFVVPLVLLSTIAVFGLFEFNARRDANLELHTKLDELVSPVVDHGALDVGIDGQRGENQLDLLVLDIPQRFGHHRALDGNQLVQLVVKLEVRVAAGIELE